MTNINNGPLTKNIEEGAVPQGWTNSLGMRFRLVEGGCFAMGSPRAEPRRFADEEQRTTTISHSFFLSAYLTTQAEWRAVMGENPSKFSGSKKAPVESVSWIDCARFLERLNSDEYQLELERYLGPYWKYSFPTEAQWEYACRAGSSTAYYFGDSFSGKEGNVDCSRLEGEAPSEKGRANRKISSTTDVGAFPPNAWGFYDMCGNVCEWTADYYADYEPEDCIDPIGRIVSAERVARGGSWRSLPENCRSAARFNFLSAYRGDNCGLRVAIVGADAH